MATSAGGPDGDAASSMMLFHSPQAAHLPDQREVTAPQAWQTKALEALAMMVSLAADIAPRGAGAEIGEDLVVDGAGVGGERRAAGTCVPISSTQAPRRARSARARRSHRR